MDTRDMCWISAGQSRHHRQSAGQPEKQLLSTPFLNYKDVGSAGATRWQGKGLVNVTRTHVLFEPTSGSVVHQ